VRRIVGYRRLEGLPAAAALGRLYAAARLCVNMFQPSFKLAEKEREGARVRKHYHPPATAYNRLLADPRTSEAVRAHRPVFCPAVQAANNAFLRAVTTTDLLLVVPIRPREWLGPRALSREPERGHKGPFSWPGQAAAVAICHACPASALKSRRVQRETRWR
jgi:hypothetical protein